MKNTIFLCMCLVALAGCKKNDFLKENTDIAYANSTKSSWIKPLKWETSGTAGITKYSIIEDPQLNDEAINNGLVLIFLKSDNETTYSLPFQNENLTIYYHLQKGHLTVYQQIHKAEFSKSDFSLSYIIISKEKIAALKKEDIEVNDLVNLSYNEILKINNH